MKRKPGTLILLALCCYVVPYLGMTLAGGYIPFTSGTNGIKDWIWAPKFISDDTGRFRPGVFHVFLPLFWLDCRFWHNDWTGSSGPHTTLKPPAWRLGLLKGSNRDVVVHQLELARARIMTNTSELLRAEYKTADLRSPVQVEIRFEEGQITNIRYHFQ
jgi:hypothetical protein